MFRLRRIAVSRSFVVVAAAICASLAGLRPEAACAGGGPENLFLVVNARSWSSLTVANHYMRLRKVPLSNVFYLDWPYDNERVDAETMRTKLLAPILEEIGRRGLADHIDYVAYSTDFPWSVDCTSETAGANLSQYLAPIASINGATFLYQDFLAKRYELLLLDANKYFRPVPRGGVPSSQGFRGWYGWGKDGKLLEAGGQRYLLSAMLGVTSGRGMSTDDVVRNLTRSVGADYTRPAGTIYFARNDDVRSKTRQDLFPAAVNALAALRVGGQEVEGILPQGRGDVMGAMIGAEQFSWKASRSTVRPGAICEHLTSTGGVMFFGAAQTPLTESLAAGAAASSGAVTEPYAIPQKFPTAFMHVHYARGCSLAESFYQAVNGPYQLLIVGDPLCRPWADPPRVSVVGAAADETVRGELTLTPSAKMPAGIETARYELYVDGLFNQSCRDGESMRFDTRTLADGYHELRVMAVSAGPIETRGGLLVPVTTANFHRTVSLERLDAGPVRWDAPLRLRVQADAAVGIVVAQGSRTLARVRGTAGEVSLNPRLLGLGPVVLQAAAVGTAGPTSNSLSAPLEFEVTANEPTSFTIPGGANFKPGMRLTQDDGPPQTLMQMTPDRWLGDVGIVPGESFSLVGFFSADRDGTYQFQLRHKMKASLLVDDVVVYDGENAETALDYVPVALKAGLHKMELRGRAGEDRGCEIRFGYSGFARLQPAALTYIP